jgi:hypothetical protein
MRAVVGKFKNGAILVLATNKVARAIKRVFDAIEPDDAVVDPHERPLAGVLERISQRIEIGIVAQAAAHGFAPVLFDLFLARGLQADAVARGVESVAMAIAAVLAADEPPRQVVVVALDALVEAGFLDEPIHGVVDEALPGVTGGEDVGEFGIKFLL